LTDANKIDKVPSRSFELGDKMIEWKLLQEWQKDWFLPSEEAVTKRRVFLRRALSYEQSHFSRAVQTLRYGRVRLIEVYADVYTDQLEMDSSVARTTNLERFLELAVRPGANGLPDPQRWFEAVSRFDQAVSIAKIEMEDSNESLDRDMSDLIDFLSAELFVDGFEKIEIYCYHNPKNGYGVKAEDIGIGKTLSRPGFMQRKSDLTCRKTVHNELAYMRDRIKDPFAAWLKMQRQIHDPHKQDPFMVNDRCGLTFIVENMQELNNFAPQLVALLLEDGGREIESLDMNHHTQQSIDAKNSQSSSSYKAAKALIEWHGRVFEFQFLTLHDYFTIKRSLLDSNHDLYRLRQTLDHFLPLLWPKEIYDIDWVNPGVRHTLRTWKISQLGWRVNGEEL
jgi:hypothetical protein